MQNHKNQQISQTGVTENIADNRETIEKQMFD